MDDKLTNLSQLHQLSVRTNSLIAKVASATVDALEELNENKQDVETAMTEEKVLALISSAGGFSPQIIVPTETGDVVNCSSGSKVIQQTATGSEVIFSVPSYGTWKVTAKRGLITASNPASIVVDAVKQYHVTEAFIFPPPKIYGVEWDWENGNLSKGVRTDEAASFGDPSPALSNGTGSSPFDDLMPWSGMVREERAGGTEVKEPKYWFKWTKTGKKMKLQIADGPVEGFHVDPVNMDRGDGFGEVDFSYIGRYHSVSGWKSETGKAQVCDMTRGAAREGIHGLGENIWQVDFAQFWYVGMLFLVEFADWNAQDTIGYGCAASGTKANNGATDSMEYHTGTTAASRTTYGFTQYRNIEGWWDNVMDWLDGCYYTPDGFYVIMSPAKCSEDSNGTFIGMTTNYYPIDFAIPTQSGLEWALYPIESTRTNKGEYDPDDWYYYSDSPCLFHGGYSKGLKNSGPFHIDCVTDGTLPTFMKGCIGCRLQERPKES